MPNNNNKPKRRQIRLPIRFKMLLSILLIVLTITCTITYLMARIFHNDKASYMADLTSSLTLSLSKEVNTSLTGYRDQLLIFARLIYERDISQQHKSRLVKQIFEDFDEFIAIGISEKGLDPVYIYDLNRLGAFGLDQDSIRKYHAENDPTSYALKNGQGFVENSTLSPELPAFSLSIPHSHPDDGRPVVITAMISLEELLKTTSTSQIHDSFILDSRGIILNHPDLSYVVKRSKADWIPDLGTLHDGLSKSISLKITRQDQNYIAAFAMTEFAGLLVGVQIAENIAFLTARDFLNRLLLASFTYLICAAAFGLIISRRLTGPLEQLTRATREVAKGNFMVKIRPESNDEIGNLTNSFNKMAAELDAREKALVEAEELANRDGLTGLYNHRHFQESLASEITRSKRYKLQFSLIFCDLDHFKNYNDTNGHLEGDYLLKELGNILSHRLRENDTLARYGGEEFVIILPETSKIEGAEVAENLRKIIAEHPFKGESTQPLGRVTASMGVSSFPEDGKTGPAIIQHADQLLYKAKADGRNLVCF